MRVRLKDQESTLFKKEGSAVANECQLTVSMVSEWSFFLLRKQGVADRLLLCVVSKSCREINEIWRLNSPN